MEQELSYVVLASSENANPEKVPLPCTGHAFFVYQSRKIEKVLLVIISNSCLALQWYIKRGRSEVLIVPANEKEHSQVAVRSIPDGLTSASTRGSKLIGFYTKELLLDSF